MPKRIVAEVKNHHKRIVAYRSRTTRILQKNRAFSLKSETYRTFYFAFLGSNFTLFSGVFDVV
jgi:hypothetical protein